MVAIHLVKNKENIMKNIINTNDLKIRLCTSEDVKDIYELQNIVIEYFKENEKGYFFHLKKKAI